MYDLDNSRVGGRQQSSGDRAAGSRSSPLEIRTSVAVDYWVIDETGELAGPDSTAMVPGAAATASPHSVTVETPLCGSCGELQESLDARLRRTVTAAHDQGCRLLPLGLRPDLLDDTQPSLDGMSDDHPSPTPTAGTRIGFETDSTAAVDVYNVLVALEPAFVLVNTASRIEDGHQYACGRSSLYHRGITDDNHSDDRPARRESSDWQPVELLDSNTVVWQSLDPAPPTLLVDLIADICTILQSTSEYRIEIDSFGSGFQSDRLVLPDAEWRALYVREAVEKGLSSLPVRAYLERLGLSTDWYRTSRLPTVDIQSSTELPAVCRQRAAELEADLGLGAPS